MLDIFPIQTSVAHPQRGNCHRSNVEFTDHADEINEAGVDIGQLRRCTPVFLGGKVDDVFRSVELSGVDDEHLAGGNFAAFARLFVGGEHLGVAAFELQRNSLAHHPNTVDGVDERFGVSPKEVARAVRDHMASSFLSSTCRA